MAFNDAMIEALCNLADELAAAATFRDGFALFEEPIGIKSSLCSTWEKFGDTAWDDFFEWNGFVEGLESLGLKSNTLIYMFFGEGAPGMSSDKIFAVIPLPSGRRIYTRYWDFDDEPMIMSVSEKHSTSLVDLKFLQYLFMNSLS